MLGKILRNRDLDKNYLNKNFYNNLFTLLKDIY